MKPSRREPAENRPRPTLRCSGTSGRLGPGKRGHRRADRRRRVARTERQDFPTGLSRESFPLRPATSLSYSPPPLPFLLPSASPPKGIQGSKPLSNNTSLIQTTAPDPHPTASAPVASATCGWLSGSRGCRRCLWCPLLGPLIGCIASSKYLSYIGFVHKYRSSPLPPSPQNTAPAEVVVPRGSLDRPSRTASFGAM